MDETNEEGKYCVYMHTSPSGKVYIGITSCKPIERWGSDGRGYLGKNKKGKFSQPAMAHAVIKYSDWSKWAHDIIATDLSSTEAKLMEQQLIAKYQSNNNNYGYNISPGGECARLSEETKKKISVSKKGTHASKTARQNMSNAQKERWNDDLRNEVSEKYSGSGNPMFSVHRYGSLAPMFGKKHSDETKKKISESKLGGNNPCSKQVVCLETGVVYDSGAGAERKTGIKRQTILACCNHEPHRKTAGGFHWEFYDIYIKQGSDMLCVF